MTGYRSIPSILDEGMEDLLRPELREQLERREKALRCDVFCGAAGSLTRTAKPYLVALEL